MPNPTQMSTLDITPSPRVLEMLGEIEFAPWRCAAELLDNAIDGFLDVLEDNPDYDGPQRVNIVLPRTTDPASTAAITVVDTGVGMSLEQVNDAVRAGWSGNDPFENLGLFGMGFNIATARLGQRTKVLTTRSGDPDWYGVQIDLQDLQASNSFEVPVVREPKDDPATHGTKVEVSRLRPGNYEDLSRSPRRLSDTLGDVYAPLLLEHPGIEIRVNNIRVEPRPYCVWSEEREVKYGSGASAEIIPAVVRFDEPLPERAACRSCRRWQESPNVTQCEFCDSDDLVVKERRIHGWIGVQRYLHTSEYGIDFVRNGRKILIRDKSMFRWTDPNDVSNTELIEYPIEPPANEGRIVGEVHIDHVPVEYRKETFRQDSPEWQATRRFLRGDGGPMRPKHRTDLKMDRFADGPLARIYKAFNANRPGARYLIPAAPNGPALHDKAREWAKKFYDGDPDYEGDTIWWSAIEGYERAKQGDTGNLADLVDASADAHRDELVDIFGEDALSGGDPVDDDKASEDTPDYTPDDGDGKDEATPETYLERVERYADTYLPLPELQFNVALPGALQAVDLTTFMVDGEEVLSDENVRVPVHAFLGKLNQLHVFVDANHPLFTQYDTQVADIVLAEVADVFRSRYDTTMTLGQIISRIKAEKMSDRRLDDNVAVEADAVLRRIRESAQRVMSADEQVAARVVELLTDQERSAAETSASSEELKTFDQAVTDGSLAWYVPALALPRIISDMPEQFLDGKVFSTLYANVGEAPRRIGLAQLVGYLYDIGILADRPIRLRGEALRRASLSIRLLEDQVVDDADAA